MWGLFSELLDDLNKPFSYKLFIGDQPYQPIIALDGQAYNICKTLGLEDDWLTDPVKVISEDRWVLGPQKYICPSIHDNLTDDALLIVYSNLVKYWAILEDLKSVPDVVWQKA